MYRSKVRATTKELAEIKKLQAKASKVPVIMTHLPGGGPASWSHQDLLQHVHKLALKHGLPEQKGFYGLDPSTGEFLSQYPINKD